MHLHGLGGPLTPEPAAGPAVGRQRSRLEQLYGQDAGADAVASLEQFGYTAFRSPDLLESPRTPPADYKLGPGDEVIVQVVGSFNLQERLRIDAEGQVRLGEIGRVSALGVTPEGLRQRIHTELARTRKNFRCSVSVSALRSIRVHVTGHVATPGPVMIPATGGVLEALAAAGGPLKSGSLRRVLRRGGVGVERVDLYTYLRGEDRALGPPLLEGDSLHVPAVGNTVAVAGVVGAPAIYELVEEVTVGEALELAGGLSAFAFTPRLRIERSLGGEARQQLEVEPPFVQPMQPGDLLRVEAIDSQRKNVRVRVSGQVLRPGNYRHRSGLRLSELVTLADGLTVDAYLPQAIVSRQVAVGEGGARAQRRLKVVDLGRALAGDLQHDIVLEPLDWVRVLAHGEAEAQRAVSVEGAVLRPGRYPWTPGMRAADLLALAGNALAHANQRAELVRRVYDQDRGERSVARYPVRLAVTSADPYNPTLLPDDRLVVRTLRVTTVRVQVAGLVAYPGDYELPGGATISDLVRAAGGLLPQADLRASVFTRERVRALQQERLRHLAERTQRLHQQALEHLIRDGHGNEALAGRLSLSQSKDTVDRMQRVEATGRIVLPLARTDFPGSDADLTLESGDRLLIKRQARTVSVAGHVVNPSTFVARAGLTLEDVLSDAGGLLEDGDDERIYVVRADGIVQSLDRGSRPLDWDSPLFAGDVVLVPRRPLERGLGNQLADGLAAARQMSEIALILSKAASPQSSVALSSQGPDNGPQRTFEGYEAAAGR